MKKFSIKKFSFKEIEPKVVKVREFGGKPINRLLLLVDFSENAEKPDFWPPFIQIFRTDRDIVPVSLNRMNSNSKMNQVRYKLHIFDNKLKLLR